MDEADHKELLRDLAEWCRQQALDHDVIPSIAEDYAADAAAIEWALERIAELEREQEILGWNLGGCSTYALGYDLDKEPAPDRARPALLDVRKMARENAQLRAERDALAADARRYHAVRDSGEFVVMLIDDGDDGTGINGTEVDLDALDAVADAIDAAMQPPTDGA